MITSSGSRGGITGGPSGVTGTSSPSEIAFCLRGTGFAPDRSIAPLSIQRAIVSREAAGSLSDPGGIFGSDSWLASMNRYEPDASPGEITSPELPPAIV